LNPEMRKRVLEALRTLDLDPWLSLDGASITDVGRAPVMLIWYRDSRFPERRFGAWWDFHKYEEFLSDPAEAEYLATHAKIWLEELASAGGAIDQRPMDEHGMRWGEMDWAVYPHQLPPHLRPDD
jgi:hypothetical protein